MLKVIFVSEGNERDALDPGVGGHKKAVGTKTLL